MKSNDLVLKPSFKYFILNNWYVPFIIGLLIYFKSYFNIYISFFAILISIILLLKTLYNLFFFMSIKFTITNEMIISEYGFFRKTIDYMELYRVFDYQIKQTVFENLFGLMSVFIIGRDVTNPSLKIFGINFDVLLIPKIRSLVEHSKRENNIYELNQML